MHRRKTSKRPARKVKVPIDGAMSVREAGRLGGLKGGRKGGLAVKKERGVEFFQEIGRLGGRRVRDLIAAGLKATTRRGRRTHRMSLRGD